MRAGLALIAALVSIPGCLSPVDEPEAPLPEAPRAWALEGCEIRVWIMNAPLDATQSVLPDGWTATEWLPGAGLLEAFVMECAGAQFAMAAVAVEDPGRANSTAGDYYAVHTWMPDGPLRDGLARGGWSSTAAHVASESAPLVQLDLPGFTAAGAPAPAQPSPPGALDYWSGSFDDPVRLNQAWLDEVSSGFGPAHACAFADDFPLAGAMSTGCPTAQTANIGPTRIALAIE